MIIERDSNSSDAHIGNSAVVAALVMAMDEAGVLSSSRYRDLLNSLWVGMPREVALGDAGAVIEQMLDRIEIESFSAVAR